jgi:hypothetical protein
VCEVSRGEERRPVSGEDGDPEQMVAVEGLSRAIPTHPTAPEHPEIGGYQPHLQRRSLREEKRKDRHGGTEEARKHRRC